MLNKKTLLTASNLNNAFISKLDTNTQSINSNLTIIGGAMTLKNSVLTDNASTAYLRIDPQGNQVIIYDGVNNQRLDVFSSSGSESTYIQTINGTTSIGQIDVASAVDHLELMTNTNKKVLFGGSIESKSQITVLNPNNISASAFLGWLNDDPRIRIGGNGSGSTGTFRIQSTGDADRLTVDNVGNTWTKGTLTATGKITASGGIGLISANSLSFDTYGGGFNMTDTTWIRTTGSKSFYMNAGTLRTDGTLQVGNNGATLNAPASGTFSVHNGKFTVATGGAITATGPISMTTAKGANTGISLDGLTIDTVSGTGGDIVFRNLNQMRFTDSSNWNWNDWAGIKYDSTNLKMYIGGPASAQFSSNANPATIGVVFDGISSLTVNGSLFTSDGKDITQQNASIVQNMPNTGGWARGMWWKNTNGSTTYGGLGIYGDTTTVNSIYLSHGTAPYSDNLGIAIIPNGSVGVGTSSPLKRLDVKGDIRTSGNIYGGLTSLGFLTDAGGALPIKASSLALTSSYANNAPANGLYVQGSAGIGTATPTKALDVSGDIRLTSNIFSPSSISIYTDTTTAQGLKVGALVVSSSYANTAPTNGLYVEGNVGIGVTSGTSKLEVAGSVKLTSSIISTATGATDVIIATGSTGNKTVNFANGNFRFWNPTALEMMTLSSGGNVGINQASPAYRLDVNGTMNVTGILYSPASNSESIRIGDESSLWDINIANTMGLYGVANTAVGGLKLGSTGPTLYGSGSSLGINTTAPLSTMALDVNGSIRIGSGKGIFSAYNNSYVLNDHANGNITLSATSGNLYLGYQNTTNTVLSAKLLTSNLASNIIDTDGTLYYKGVNTNSVYLRLDGTNTATADLSLGNNKLLGISYLEGQYGNIASSRDEWLRLNDGGTHTSGVYVGTSILRTDGELQVGNAGANFKANTEGVSINTSTSRMPLKLTGTDLTNNNNYIGFYQSNDTTRQGWIGFGGSTSNQLGLYNDGGDITLVPGGSANGKVIVTNTFNIEIGATKYYNGTAAGGDAIYSPSGQLILGGNTNVAVWAETGNFSVRTGAMSASTVALSVTATQSTFQGSLLIDNAADVDGANDKGLTLRDSSDNVITFDPNEMWIVNASNVRTPYTFNASYMQMNIGTGTKRIPRVSWGTAAPPATNVVDGDIYVQY